MGGERGGWPARTEPDFLQQDVQATDTTNPESPQAISSPFFFSVPSDLSSLNQTQVFTPAPPTGDLGYTSPFQFARRRRPPRCRSMAAGPPQSLLTGTQAIAAGGPYSWGQGGKQ